MGICWQWEKCRISPANNRALVLPERYLLVLELLSKMWTLITLNGWKTKKKKKKRRDPSFFFPLSGRHSHETFQSSRKKRPREWPLLAACTRLTCRHNHFPWTRRWHCWDTLMGCTGSAASCTLRPHYHLRRHIRSPARRGKKQTRSSVS